MYPLHSRTVVSDFLCFIFVFFSLFGWKYSVVDFSLLIPGLVAVLSSRVARFEKHLLSVAFGMLILVFYQVAVQIILFESDIESILRLFRCFLFCLLASFLAGSRCFTPKQLVNAIFFALIFHALTIVFAGIFEPVNDFFSALSGNDRVRPFRASGLLAGFDLAGFFCVAGAAMLVFEVYVPKSRLRFLTFFFVFGWGAFFTSRLTVAWILVLTVFSGATLYKSTSNVLLRIMYVGVFSCITLYVVWNYFLPVIDVTYSLNWIAVSDESAADITSRHAQQQDGNLFWEDMFYLPSDWVGLVFGRGQDVLGSDVGYIKDIFRYGIVGVLYSFVLYAIILKMSLGRVKKYFAQGYARYVWLIFLFTVVMSLKNNYFYTRGVFSLLIIFLCVFYLVDRKALQGGGARRHLDGQLR